MLSDGILASELSHVISEATAPAFLLGAVVGFLSVVVGRMNTVIDRITGLIAVSGEDLKSERIRSAMPSLLRRERLMSRAVEFAILSGISTTLLVIVAFASAALRLQRAYGAAALFVLALILFSVSLTYLWIDVRAARGDLDRFV